jgi:hypothetical protein
MSLLIIYLILFSKVARASVPPQFVFELMLNLILIIVWRVDKLNTLSSTIIILFYSISPPDLELIAMSKKSSTLSLLFSLIMSVLGGKSLILLYFLSIIFFDKPRLPLLDSSDYNCFCGFS